MAGVTIATSLSLAAAIIGSMLLSSCWAGGGGSKRVVGLVFAAMPNAKQDTDVSWGWRMV